jgi:oligosaccharide repeat unit polymerase
MWNLSDKHGHLKWLLILGSLLMLCIGETLSRWLGLYGSAALVCLVCGMVVRVMRISGRQFDIANVLFLFVGHYFLSFGLYGFMNAFGLSHYLGVSYDPTSDSPANLSSLASVYSVSLLLAIYAGFSWSPRVCDGVESTSGHPRGTFPTVDLEMLPRLQASALFALGLSYLGCFFMVLFLGGWSTIGLDPSYVSTEGMHGLYWAAALVFTNHWAVAVNLFSYLILKKIKYLFLAGLSLPLLLIEFLLSGSKSALLLPIMAFLIIRHYCYRRMNWKTLGALSAIVLVVFAAGYAYRSTGAQSSQFQEGVTSYYQSPTSLLETFVGRFYGTDSFAIALDAVRNGQPLMLGRSLVDLFTWYIPRWLWPEKPLSFAIVFGQEYMPNSPGAGEVYYSPSLPGEMYVDFGLLGLPFGGIFIGYLLRYINRRTIEARPQKIEAIVLYGVIAPLTAALTEGPLSGVIELVLTRVILYVILLWFAGAVSAPVLRRRPA